MFSAFIEKDTLHDAFMTWTTFFQLEYGKLDIINEKRSFVKISWDALKDVANIGWDRIDATTAEEAYPVTDRPRNENDLLSVKYHIDIIDGKNKNRISPPIIYKVNGKCFFMDGMHRLVALSIRKYSDLFFCLIDWDK